ncbi:MAG: hypothetical protein HYZ17_14085 [Betaproteobacteria bacterium]|nr:hypothetical protein [Betaproteobacteria bacterium]
MTTLELTLPDQLAREAQAAGLLTPQALEAMVRENLRKQRVDELFAAMQRMHAVNTPPLTEEEIQAEIDAARAERRARRS